MAATSAKDKPTASKKNIFSSYALDTNFQLIMFYTGASFSAVDAFYFFEKY